MGVKWIVGNGKKIRFWEDTWVGNTSLAILYWLLYVINEQQGKTLSDVWDGFELKLTFRRTVSENLMNLWWELVSLMDDLSFSEEEDHILWAYTSSGKYEVQSLYAVISFRGVAPVYVSSVWNLSVPPMVQFFLWLVSKNRVLTRDNLAKRQEVSDPTCLLCNELESVTHLFFECCVARLIWRLISGLLGVNLGDSFESVACLWLANKKHELTNVVSSAVIWSTWKLRNEICFQGGCHGQG
jgi:hypothetical protein